MPATKLIRVSVDHQVLFLWRDGETLADASFYGYLMCDLAQDALGVIFDSTGIPVTRESTVKSPVKLN
jgi:hypothetical protein